ncbi:RNA polymerase sigma-70 factor [Sphingobacterium sp.]|uniref:RNA polymerase sigma factor n=1 Tax=Sphingobacterium sp. TaxID=341027 RepID=UPI0031D49BF4
MEACKNDDLALLHALKSSNHKAFETLYYRYSPRLYRHILNMVKIQACAEEILQDVFQKLWERRNGIDPDKSFQSYLFTIAKHLVYDFFHKEIKNRNLKELIISISTSDYSHIEEEYAYKESKKIINQAIENLSPKRKLIYTLCKIEGKSYEEVSSTLGISTSTISDHIVKATKQIQNFCLSKEITPTLLLAFISVALNQK